MIIRRSRPVSDRPRSPTNSSILRRREFIRLAGGAAMGAAAGPIAQPLCGNGTLAARLGGRPQARRSPASSRRSSPPTRS